MTEETNEETTERKRPWIRPSKNHEIRSLSLSDAEWRNLEKLATKHNTRAKHGARVGQTSWRTLIKKIAKEEIFLVTVFKTPVRKRR